MAKKLLIPVGLLVAPLAILPVGAQTKLTNQSKVVVDGVGPVRVGMTVPQASKSAGVKLVSTGDYPLGEGCYYVYPKGGPSNVAFMVTDGRIARVDIMKGSRITTRSGAKIGDTEARIKALYPGLIKVTPHEYTGPQGHYLTFIPKDRQDQKYRVVFETDGKRVTTFRSGKIPEVEFVEGCS